MTSPDSGPLIVLHGIIWGACPDWMVSEEGEALADRALAAVRGNRDLFGALLDQDTARDEQARRDQQRHEQRIHDLASELGRAQAALRMISAAVADTHQWRNRTDRDRHALAEVQRIVAPAVARFDNTGGEQS